MEMENDSDQTTAKQIGDLFEHRPDEELISSRRNFENNHNLNKIAFVKPNQQTYEAICEHIKSRLGHSGGEFLFQLGIDGKKTLS